MTESRRHVRDSKGNDII